MAAFKTLKPTRGHGAPQLRGEQGGLANKISTLGKFYVFERRYPSESSEQSEGSPRKGEPRIKTI